MQLLRSLGLNYLQKPTKKKESAIRNNRSKVSNIYICVTKGHENTCKVIQQVQKINKMQLVTTPKHGKHSTI